jgi:hypothetical protein
LPRFPHENTALRNDASLSNTNQQHLIARLLNQKGITPTVATAQLSVDCALNFGLYFGGKSGAHRKTADVMFEKHFHQTVNARHFQGHPSKGDHPTRCLNEKAVGWIFYSERVIMVDLRAASFDNPPCDFFFLRHGFQPIHGKPALDQSGIENADSLTATGGASNCNWVVCPVHQATASRNNGWFNAKLWRNPYEPASNAFFRCATNPQRQSVYTAAAT